MNTAGRKKKSAFEDDFEHQLIGQLIDDSKFYVVANSTNKWDKTMKMASHLTSRYVEGLRLWDSSFCSQNGFICDVFSES